MEAVFKSQKKFDGHRWENHLHTIPLMNFPADPTSSKHSLIRVTTRVFSFLSKISFITIFFSSLYFHAQ